LGNAFALTNHYRAGLVLVLVLLGAGCGGSESASSERPCVVAEEEMASIWGVPDMSAHPQENDYECVYAADGRPAVSLALRSPEQVEAERAELEDQGVLLPPLEPVSGFDGEANVDPRYNSLHVVSGDEVVSVEILGAQPADPGEQLELEKQVARAAIDRLDEV
jgi:hypothetical protein